jgi:transcription elongation factor Elf1
MCNWKCPNCGKSDHSGCDVEMVTDMYFPPRYVDGVNVNPDRNGRNSTIHCNACGKRYRHEVSPHTQVVTDTEIPA